MINGQSAQSMGLNQDFPISLEVQLLGGLSDGKPRSTANLCTPGTNVHFGDSLITRHCINSTVKTYDGDQWVRVEALSLGDSIIKHIANGDTVLVYRKPEMGGGSANNTNPGVLVPGQPIVGGSISAPGRDGGDRLPEGRSAEPRGVHGSQVEELSRILHQARPAACK
jgi:hypothetical protein